MEYLQYISRDSLQFRELDNFFKRENESRIALSSQKIRSVQLFAAKNLELERF
jgi:hypothetical protein